MGKMIICRNGEVKWNDARIGFVNKQDVWRFYPSVKHAGAETSALKLSDLRDHLQRRMTKWEERRVIEMADALGERDKR